MYPISQTGWSNKSGFVPTKNDMARIVNYMNSLGPPGNMVKVYKTNRQGVKYAPYKKRSLIKARIQQAYGSAANDAALMSMDYDTGSVRSRNASSFRQQLKALVASKKRDAPDVTRNSNPLTTTVLSCLTSSTDFATAASATGILDMVGDSAMINDVHIISNLTNTCLEDVTPVGLADIMYRLIAVWFYKPLLVGSAAGTIPPITEVLVTDSVFSDIVQDTANAGRFKILYDKTYNMGTNTVAVAATGAYPRINGTINRKLDITIPIKKQIHFATSVNPISGVNGGHYDSDVTAGRVDRGLLILYQIPYAAGTGGTLISNMTTRVNFTG